MTVRPETPPTTPPIRAPCDVNFIDVTAVPVLRAPAVEVRVVDVDVEFGQCVNVLLAFEAWSSSAFSLVYTLRGPTYISADQDEWTKSQKRTRTCSTVQVIRGG